MEKIIQITSAANSGGVVLYALCEDGGVWEFCHQTGWNKLSLPIPSPNSDYEKCGCGNTGGDFYCEECLTKIAERGN